MDYNILITVGIVCVVWCIFLGIGKYLTKYKTLQENYKDLQQKYLDLGKNYSNLFVYNDTLYNQYIEMVKNIKLPKIKSHKQQQKTTDEEVRYITKEILNIIQTNFHPNDSVGLMLKEIHEYIDHHEMNNFLDDIEKGFSSN